MRRSDQFRETSLAMARSARLLALACLVVVTASASASTDEVEARVRQIYFEGYPVMTSGPLDSDEVERLGEMLRDDSEQAYWSNIVLALGASESPDAYRQLADFAAIQPAGEVSSGVYQARVSLPVALGQLSHSQPTAFGLIEQLARDLRSERGWRFQSLEGEALAGSLRRSAITGLAVSGRPEADRVLRDLEHRAVQRGRSNAAAAAVETDELLSHIAFAKTLHERVQSNGVASVLGRRPVTK